MMERDQQIRDTFTQSTIGGGINWAGRVALCGPALSPAVMQRIPGICGYTKY